MSEYDRFKVGHVRFFSENGQILEVKIASKVEAFGKTTFRFEVLGVVIGNEALKGTEFEAVHIDGTEPGWKITQSLVGATGEVGALSF